MKHDLRVAAYARISTDKDDQANSLESQKKYFADYIRMHEGWRLTSVYADEGISGTQTKNRAGFHAMIDAALRGEVDLILTKEVCRFARNTVDTLSYTRQLKDAGTGVIFTIDNIDTREPDGELRLTIMACLAQEESRKTSERVKWGQLRRMEQGVVFGRDLLGYTVRNGTLIINEQEAPIVRTIFHKYANEEKGTHVIARELTEEGIRPACISAWSNTVILRILRNEKYAGDLCQKKTITPNFLTHAKKYNHGEETMIYIKDHHEPIIGRELWNRTQAQLQQRSLSASQRSKYSSRYWCSGKIRCAECGSRFVSRTKKRKNGTFYRAWRCQEAACHGTFHLTADGRSVGCNNASVNERSLLFCVHHAIRLLLADPLKLKKEMLAELKLLENQPSAEEAETKIQAEITKLENKKRKAVDLLLDGMITREDLQAQNKWYDDEIAALRQTLLKMQKQQKTEFSETDWMNCCAAAVDPILSLADNSGRLCHEALNTIIVHSDHITDIWLNGIPFGIRMKLKTSGRLETFHTQILETAFLQQSIP